MQMCNLSEGIRKEAKFIRTVELVKNLMETGNIEINKALDMLKISEDIRQAVIDEIEKKNSLCFLYYLLNFFKILISYRLLSIISLEK